MTDAQTTGAAAPRVRWYRRRPPEGMPRFARAVWWTGHGQLFIALTFIVLGPVGVAMAFNPDLVKIVGPVGYLMVGMAAPFAASGRMLCRFGIELAADTHSLPVRILELIGVVLCIALLSIVFVFADIFVIALISYGVTTGMQ